MTERRKEKAFKQEWEALPFISQQQLPITSTIPYFYRWKINQIKLMLTDLNQLYKTHNIKAALVLYVAVQAEAEELFAKLTADIIIKRKEIEAKTK